jgi:hypothetical protein
VLGAACVTTGAAATVGVVIGVVAAVAGVSLLALLRLSARMPPITSNNSAAPSVANTIGPLLFFLA